MSHIVLIDGHHMLYRAYWAIPRTMKTSKGEQVNIAFGIASMLINIIISERPTGLLFCFDAGNNTFRHQQNETYKDGRADTPDDFYPQVPRVLELLQTFQVAEVSNPEFEADDLIASYAMYYKSKGSTVTIVSGDRDLYQLASDSISIALPHKGYQAVEYIRAPEVYTKLGVHPHQVPCYKGLCGDASDNLPGVRGIGPKIAAQLLEQYGTLESIYEHIDSIKPSIAEKLRADKESAFFCRHMATLITTIPCTLTDDDLSLQIPVSAVEELFTTLEFSLLKKRLPLLMQNEKFNIQHSAQNDHLQRKSLENSNTDQLSLF